MKNIGIIAEYNPFHNGHKYQLDELKRIYNYDNIICILSGNFVQRGEPAIYNKWLRTKLALECGASLVIELPTYYAVNTAEKFAFGGINILNSLGIIDNIAFGVEDNNPQKLNEICDVLVNEPNEYKSILKSELDKGLSYAKSRENAIVSYLNNKSYGNILNKSNNILGIEYLKALKKTNSNISPILIKRIGSKYNEKNINSNICSATAIRELLQNKNCKEKNKTLKNVIPNNCFNILKDVDNITTLKTFEKEIIYMIRKMSNDELESILEVNEGINIRLKKYSFETNDIYELINLVKSKRFTQTKIQRILIHILLNMTKNEFENINKNKYIRVLGFNKDGKNLLKQISKNTNIPVITSVNKYITEFGLNPILEKDVLSSNIYLGKYNIDYTQKIIEI